MSNKTGNSIREKADGAFLEAAAKVINRARQHGTRIVVWEDGQIVERTAEEMEISLATKSKPPHGE